ncbi:MAG: aminotransferase class IV [Chitinophagales bacterium]
MQPTGLIETIKVVNGKPMLFLLHLNRLRNGFSILNFPFSESEIRNAIENFISTNLIQNKEEETQAFRLRMEIHPSINREIYFNFSFSKLEDANYTWQEQGLPILPYLLQQKKIDTFSILKHTDRKIYNDALNYAKLNLCADAFVFNENNTLADACIYNVFMIKNNKIYTPPLSDAPVAGVMRAFLLNNFPEIEEKSISIQELYQADELFVSNAIRGIRWVSHFGEQVYDNKKTKKLFHLFLNFINDEKM